MKNMKITLSVLIAVVFAAVVSSVLGAGTTDEATREEVRKEISEAIDAIQGYSVEQRDEALHQGRKMLNSLDARIERQEERLRQQWHKMTDSTRQQTKATLRDLKEKRNDLAEWYGGLRHSSGHAWEGIKKGFTDAYSELQTAMDNAEREFETKE